jgi:cytoskeletal protein CcmA (bactofilin family)
MIAIVVLLLLTTAWVGLALLPALRELARPRDDQPLSVDMYEADVRSFATGFRRYMNEQLPNLRITRRLRGGHEGTLPDGTTLLKLVEQASPLIMHGEGLDEGEMGERTTHKLVISYARMILPRGLASVGGLYATEFVCGGESGVFRALLGERDVVLGRNSTVLRWIHSDANLTVEEGSILHGRASADRQLYLAPDTQFERLYGRPVMFGESSLPASATDSSETLTAFATEGVLDASPSRTVIDGDVVIPPASQLDGNLVVRGSLTVGRGSRVRGSLKCHGSMIIEAGVSVSGSTVAHESIEVHDGAMVGGPVIAEADVTLGDGVLVGEYASPSTVTAERVFVYPGAAVFGTVWTRECGMVLAAARSNSAAA